MTAPSLKALAAAAEVMQVELAELFAGLGDSEQLSAKRAELEGVMNRLSRDLDGQRRAFIVESGITNSWER